jgi:hypothetical protein
MKTYNGYTVYIYIIIIYICYVRIYIVCKFYTYVNVFINMSTHTRFL